MKMNKITFVFVIAILSISLIQALSESDIIYPVPELGNCANEEECINYCDNLENLEACLSFAEKYNLMPKEEIEEARKVLPFLLAGTTPGGCKSEEECDSYCDEDNNIMECVEFAKKAGFISDEEYDMIKKTGGKGPAGCKREECKTYCEDESHFSECIEFAKEHGLISDEEYEMAKKTGGKGPGNCRGKEECEGYCQDDSHFTECVEFAKEHGFMSDEDYERVKKIGTFSGPGGCKGEECRDFCEKPENQEECMRFAGEHGLISEEEVRQRAEGGGAPQACIERGYTDRESCESFCRSNPEECGFGGENREEFGGSEGSGEFQEGQQGEFDQPPPGEFSGEIPQNGFQEGQTPSESGEGTTTSESGSPGSEGSFEGGDSGGITGGTIRNQEGEGSIFNKIVEFFKELLS